MMTFKSRLFRRIIKPDNLAYWNYLYAEILFRLKQNTDLLCPCGPCFRDKLHYEWLINQLENEGKIEKNKRPLNFYKKGDCGGSTDESLPPAVQ